MRTLLLTLCLLAPLPAWAQAPTRAAEVAAIASAHPETFQGPASQADERKLLLLHVIVRTLNQQDGGQWGELLKTDQNGRIPADTLVWRQTMEHFDVLTDNGPMWGPNGVVGNPRWLWLAVDGVVPPIVNPPGPIVTPPVIVPGVSPELRALLEALAERDYQQAERIYADLSAKVTAVDYRLKQHDENPSFIGKLFGSRYTQMLLAAAAAVISTRQMTP